MANYPYQDLGIDLNQENYESLNKNFDDIESDLKALQGQINTLTIYPGDSSAEVLQARTGYNGSTYATLNDRLNAEAIPESKQGEWDAKETPEGAQQKIDDALDVPWTLLSYQNGFTTADTRPLKARVVGKMLHITGLVAPSSPGGLGTVATLPAGLRPLSTYNVVIASFQGLAEVIISATGTITITAIRAGNTSATNYYILAAVPIN